MQQNQSERDKLRIIKGLVGAYDFYCSGAKASESYVTAPFISVAKTPLDSSHSGSQLLDKIVAFDKAEGLVANITQTNLVQVSSFNGINGLVVGYDLLPVTPVPSPLVNREKHANVFALSSLEHASTALLGTVKKKHFPIAPGEQTLCAYKTHYEKGPCILYGSLALAIPFDRSRNADLYMEDNGVLMGSLHNTKGVQQQAQLVAENMLHSIKKIEENLGIKYEKIFLGVKHLPIEASEVGCVITAAPYLQLPKKSFSGLKIQDLLKLDPDAWIKKVGKHFLDHVP